MQTNLDVMSLALNGHTESGAGTPYFEIQVQLTYLNSKGALMYLAGLPVAYRITDQGTGRNVKDFRGATVSNQRFQGCAVGYSIGARKRTAASPVALAARAQARSRSARAHPLRARLLRLTGEPIEPAPGAPLLPPCFSGTVTASYRDLLDLDASFAGTSAYAASKSSGFL